ncbi:MAG: hypothetical protein IJ493_07775 [Clostridia bacterium]|nr:hypothetical protein [Clostridia bacterium]
MWKKYIGLLILCCMTLAGCGKETATDWLAYQQSALTIDGVFDLNGETLEADIELAAPEYDGEGRMLARSAKVTFGDNSLVAGISFEFDGEEAYVVSGVLKIPLEDETLIGGITDMISLFCISPDSFWEAEETELDGQSCVKAVYVDGEDSVEVLIDPESMLPMRITATLGEEQLSAEIRAITAE